ncbi:Extra-cytoplasmic solute receptor [Cupriavidus taiwanensis]|uniref:Bug family tripartite tricarboxylate transporter substrate binding protein n=1 Tax=Cupriavidus taiwanensis TaxID=164546 RepID=UPI000E18AD0D|nr:tripartite tricarboxylate transporter substrate binding protein [Cupriavidus taiwanensis]SPA34274.1 Extra-cytoplasmic solute receptor [Cupriavidus taiwanensis]
MQAIYPSAWQAQSSARRRPRRQYGAAVVIGLAALLWGAAAIAQPSPAAGTERLDKPVRIIVAYGAGGASDSIARFVGDGLSRRAGKPVIVENKAGADGNIAAETAVRAAPDAYTLLVSGSSTHAANATIYRKLPYDPEADFTPLATMASTPFVLLVNPKRVQAATFKEFLALARKESSSLSFASANVGGRITGELFKQRAGVKAVNVPYKNSSQAMTDLIGGQFDYYLCDMVTALPQIQAGTVRALAISSAERAPSLPDVPTLAESGFPDFDVSSWIAIWSANASTPQPVARLLSRWIAETLDSPNGRQFLVGKGLIPAKVAPTHLQELQRRDTRLWGKIIVDAGMQQP